jgi:hypothetical protein
MQNETQKIRYTDNGYGTVTDNQTELIWLMDSVVSVMVQKLVIGVYRRRMSGR